MSLLKVRSPPQLQKSGQAIQEERLRKDQLIETQQKQIESNVKTNLVAQWAESLDEMCERKILKRRNEEMSRELQLGNKCINKVRQDQLRQLLEKEQIEYEQELHAMGLAIHKERL
ncbi:cilia- and flagella-associated protein 141-like [Dysidea avara]|uniref:cilia- and flagella-associated protein 141-like n=1 Tax=Dysidea avara TaxID=196820 RepID=UPI00331A7AC6